jgi:hypothetical protein
MTSTGTVVKYSNTMLVSRVSVLYAVKPLSKVMVRGRAAIGGSQKGVSKDMSTRSFVNGWDRGKPWHYRNYTVLHHSASWGITISNLFDEVRVRIKQHNMEVLHGMDGL